VAWASATQIAKGIGAEIFGTASASKHDAIRAQGVDHPIDYRTADFEEEVLRITGGQGVDVILDALGPTSFRKDYRLLRDGGLLVVTTLGPELVWSRPDLDAAQRQQLASHGFVFAHGAASFNEDSSFQTRDYLAREWPGFTLLEHTTHGLASYQDLSVFAKGSR